MKNLLNYLPSWKTTKMFLNIIYYVGFIFWFLSRIYVIIFKPEMSQYTSVINNDDIFIALIFITFFILDVKEDIVNKRNK
jgi:hypothetical protein